MKLSLLEIDTKDDRKEIWSLLHHLRPGLRVRFLKWASGLSTQGPCEPIYKREKIESAMRCDEGDRRLTNEVYGDLILLGAQYQADMVTIAKKLEETVKANR